MKITQLLFILAVAAGASACSMDPTKKLGLTAGQDSTQTGTPPPVDPTVPGTTTPQSQPDNYVNDPMFFVFVTYLDVLGRLPDAGGLEFWQNEFTTASSSCSGDDIECFAGARAKIVLQFFNSAEFGPKTCLDVLLGSRVFESAEERDAFIWVLYAKLLRRAPDDEGYAFWKDRFDSDLDSGMTLAETQEDIVRNFVGGDEYKARFDKDQIGATTSEDGESSSCH